MAHRRVRPALVAAMLVAFVSACQGDQRPTGPSTRDGAPRTSLSTAGDLDARIHALIDSLFPTGLKTAATTRWDAVVRQNAATPRGTLPDGSAGPAAASRKMLVQLTAWLQSKTGDVTAADGETPDHAVARLVLYTALYVYGGSNTPVPVITPSSDAALGIVQPTAADTITTPTSHAVVAFPAGAVSEPTVVVVAQEAAYYPQNCSGPLNTKLCQYPQFYHYNVFPDVRLNQPAKVGVCHVNSGTSRVPLADHNRFRLAHDLPADPRDYTPGATQTDSIEILPYVQVGALMNCDVGDSYAPPPSSYRAAPGRRFGALWRSLQRFPQRMASAVGRLIAPKPAYAIDQGGGGDVLIFSNFAVVDPQGTADIALSSTSVTPESLTFYPSDTFHIAGVSITNAGSATAGTFGWQVVFSPDPDFPQSSTVPAGASDSATSLAPRSLAAYTPLSAQIPPGTKPGTYYIGVLADTPDAVGDTNTANNYIAIPVIVLDPTWNIFRDFSSSQNPNGAWTLGWESTPGATLNTYPAVLTSGYPTWYDPAIPSDLHIPLVGQNTGIGLVALHPGPQGQRSVVRWTAPASGVYQIDARFVDLDRGLTDMYVLRDSNAGAPLAQLLSASGDMPYSGQLTLAAGETIDFVLGEGNDGNGFDTTGLTVAISRLGP